MLTVPVVTHRPVGPLFSAQLERQPSLRLLDTTEESVRGANLEVALTFLHLSPSQRNKPPQFHYLDEVYLKHHQRLLYQRPNACRQASRDRSQLPACSPFRLTARVFKPLSIPGTSTCMPLSDVHQQAQQSDYCSYTAPLQQHTACLLSNAAHLPAHTCWQAAKVT
jgi:hypothetical protein